MTAAGGGWRRLAVEETGEVFRYKVCAASRRELRQLMEARMQSGLRVTRPVFRGTGSQMRSVYAVRVAGFAASAERTSVRGRREVEVGGWRVWREGRLEGGEC